MTSHQDKANPPPLFRRETINQSRLFLADCLDALPILADGSVDSIVTDPP
jgi:DNA modification methylase